MGILKKYMDMVHDKLVEYKKEELELIEKIKLIDLKKRIDLIVFLDSSYTEKNIISCFIFYDYSQKKVLKKKNVISNIDFPYIPTYLSLREGPNYIKGLNDEDYDLIIVDGQGIAHPRKMGIATYLGVKLNKPSIGVAKSILYGTFKAPNKNRGNYSEIFNDSGELIGYALTTKDRVKPVFISPGNLISFKDTLDIILSLSNKYRIPDILREVHLYSREMKRYLNENIHNR